MAFFRDRWQLIRLGVFIVALVPLLLMVMRIIQNDLGPDPAKTLSLETGRWALRFLLVALAVTPFRELTGIRRAGILRRMLGLYAWFYASLHLLVYLMFLLQWRWFEIADDILERPYITVGFSAFLILTALGLTSNRWAMRKLGVQWKRMHRLVYLAGVLALLHFVWILRSDLADAAFYGSILILLLGYRLFQFLRRSHRTKA